MLCVLIMAGGRGTRFWPASTDEKPKQFLRLIGNDTMLQSTVNRLLPYVPVNQIFICTSKQYVNLCREQVPIIPNENIIVEPIGRNTAPCILLSTKYIKERYENTNIVVLPSDHIISDQNQFVEVLETADRFIEQNLGIGIVTIGIKPNRPETGYGYINQGKKICLNLKSIIYEVTKFVEKPDIKKALYYLKNGNYLWNAGMFIFNSSFMIEQFKEYNKKNYDILNRLPASDQENFYLELEKIYKSCESISIDYAIMENSKDIYVIPADFGWDDVGSWSALERYLSSDINNNISNTSSKFINSKNNIVFSDSQEIIFLNIENIFFFFFILMIIIGDKNSINKVVMLKEE